jgi:signal transduction histidine kinase
MPFASTRRRLVAWNLVVFAAVLVAMIAVAVGGEVGAHGAAIDRALRAAASRAASAVAHDLEERLEHDGRGDHREREEDHDHHDRRARESPPAYVATLVVGEPSARVGDALVDPSAVADPIALGTAARGAATFSEATVAGEPLRLYSVPVTRAGRVLGAVQVGVPLAADRLVLSRSIAILLATGAGGLVAALVGSAFLAGRAMRPIAEAFERQRRFLADASHELRTPVAVVRARAELLARESEALPAAARDDAGRLARDAAELGALVEDLLDLSRIDAGTVELARDPVPLADVLEELAEQLEPVARERGVTLGVSADPVWARGDLARVRQIVRALVDNATKHARGAVHLRATRDRDRARIDVRDDGDGVAPEHLPRVLDRFYRADDARARGDARAPGATRPAGAGLGLAIAAELARAMGGAVTLESAVGAGTTATVHLPLADRAAR